MRNIQKWQNTENIIFGLTSAEQKEMDFKELRRRSISKPNIDEKANNPEYEHVTIMIKEATLRFFSDKLGSYIEGVFNKRNRLNIVPACFLVQLYNEQNVIKNGTSQITIPFELRSFWKMEKEIEFIGELSHILLKQKLLLQNLSKRALKNQKAIIKDALELVNSLQISPPEKGKISIQFMEEKFIVNTNNIKLDIIPLCKIIVKYYVKFITCIDTVYENFNTNYSKQKLRKIRMEFKEFMDKYFTITSGVKY